MTSEFSPRMFAKHLLSMTLHLNHKIRVFIVPKLKELTNRLIEAPTVIFAFRSSANSLELENFYDQLGTHSELLRRYLLLKPVQDISIKRKKKIKAMPETPVVLLKKINESTRSFVPMEFDSIESATTPDESAPSSDFISLLISPNNPTAQSSDFISLSKYSDISSSLLSNSSLPLYRPIKIKKVIGNANRKLKESRK